MGAPVDGGGLDRSGVVVPVGGSTGRAALQPGSPPHTLGNITAHDGGRHFDASAHHQSSRDDYGDLPNQMLQARRWIVWRSVPQPTGKPRKVPYYVDGTMRRGDLDNAEDQARLGKFEDALSALQTGQYSGLGFALGPDGTGNYWQGVDLDDLSLHGELTHLVDDLPGYTERSPSGDGIHAIGYGRRFSTLGSNDSGIEAYAERRYFTVTGVGAGLGDITCIASHVERVLAPLHRRQPKKPTDSPTQAVDAATIRDLRSALLFLRADDYDTYVGVGIALRPLGDIGRGLWMDWAGTSDKFDAGEASRKWETFHADRTDYRAVFSRAQTGGWVNPMAKTSQPMTALKTVQDSVWTRVDLRDSQPVDAPKHLVEGLLPLRVVTLLASAGGVGKSILALVIAAHVACGRSWAGLPVRMGRVLYVSAEDPAALVRWRLDRIIEVYGLPRDQVLAALEVVDGSSADAFLALETSHGGVRHLQPTAAWLELEKLADDFDLVVIDNASDTYGGDENVRRQVKSFVRMLAGMAQRLNAAVLLLAHVDKLAAKHGGHGHTYSGSTQWNDGARSRWALTQSDITLGVVILTHEKANLGKRLDPITLAWDGPVLVPGSGRASADLLADISGRDADDDDAIIAAMTAAHEAGVIVPAATSGPATALKALEPFPELGWDFAGKSGRQRFWAALLRLKRAGQVSEIEYKTAARNTRKALQLTKELTRTAAVVAEKMRCNTSPYTPGVTDARAGGLVSPGGGEDIATNATNADHCPKCLGEGCGWCRLEQPP